jgi:hypothetical protein
MGFYYSPKIVTDGLILALDAANPKSYPGSGTTWYDLCGNYDFTLTNSPTFSTHKGTPVFDFDGASDYATRGGSISHNIGLACTLTIVMASINNTNFGSCSRLFSVNDGSSTNNDYSTYFTLASCNEAKYGLWYKTSPQELYPSSDLRTANDDFKVVTYKWTASDTAFIFVNGVQEASAGMSTAFDYTAVGRMTVAMNSALNLENAYVRVASVNMYDRELTTSEVQQNYNALKSRFSI